MVTASLQILQVASKYHVPFYVSLDHNYLFAMVNWNIDLWCGSRSIGSLLSREISLGIGRELIFRFFFHMRSPVSEFMTIRTDMRHIAGHEA